MLNLTLGAIALGMAAWAFWATKKTPPLIRVENRSLDIVDERPARGPSGYGNP